MSLPEQPVPQVPGAQGADALRQWAPIARAGLVASWALVALVHLSLPSSMRPRVWPLGYLFLEALACGSLVFRARVTSGEGRLAWWFLAASAFLEVPNLLVNWLDLQEWIPSSMAILTSYLSLATGVLVLVGVLSFPKGLERGGLFRRRILDSLIFAAALLFLLWTMGLQGSLHSAVRGIGMRVIASYMNVALLGGGLVFMTSYHPERIQGPLGWLGASALAWLAGMSLWTLSGLPSVIAKEGWIIVAGGIPLFQGLAAWSDRSVRRAENGADPEQKIAGWLPYLPASFAVLVLAVMLVLAPMTLTRGAFAIFLVMVVLLMVRQLQAIEDLKAARRTLEGRVIQRTQSLERAQDMLLRTERMNSLALMGAGLAHDLNNLLAAIKASAELAAMGAEDGAPVARKDLDRISDAAGRAAQLTQRLMAFAHRETEDLKPLDLAEVVADLEATLGMLLPRSVHLKVDALPGVPLTVVSSRLRLEQMVVNLVANARDAMPGGGLLTVRAAPGDSEGRMVLLEVTDTGTGMTPDVRDRIFEPFFSTKVPGKGTGLGLPSLKAMVEEAGGQVAVESEPGQGSRFSLFLPRMSEDSWQELSPR